MRNVVITGGAGFVGSSYAVWLAERHAGIRVTVLDNLRRRGSELNLPRLRQHGIRFIHADVRQREDLESLELKADLIVDCAADASVLAGFGTDAAYVVQTNLLGTLHCLELARRTGAAVLFLSTSRVYPFRRLNEVAFHEGPERFEIADEQKITGVTVSGISEAFPLDGARTLYGTTKLASELLLHEYADAYGVRFVVNRCGVISGPWQMGMAEQGVFALWIAAHHFGLPLSYVGWGGEGKQVRDVLHIDDLCELLAIESDRMEELSGRTFNAGGGAGSSASLREATRLAREMTGREIPIGQQPENRKGDVRIYIGDNAAITRATGWQPRRSVPQILESIERWLRDHEPTLRHLWLH
jgi:CDP-paratose 2-epimerase